MIISAHYTGIIMVTYFDADVKINNLYTVDTKLKKLKIKKTTKQKFIDSSSFISVGIVYMA